MFDNHGDDAAIFVDFDEDIIVQVVGFHDVGTVGSFFGRGFTTRSGKAS